MDSCHDIDIEVLCLWLISYMPVNAIQKNDKLAGSQSERVCKQPKIGSDQI
jgi:hypothetical protein